VCSNTIRTTRMKMYFADPLKNLFSASFSGCEFFAIFFTNFSRFFWKVQVECEWDLFELFTIDTFESLMINDVRETGLLQFFMNVLVLDSFVVFINSNNFELCF
jgi:hypothetical protein